MKVNLTSDCSQEMKLAVLAGDSKLVMTMLKSGKEHPCLYKAFYEACLAKAQLAVARGNPDEAALIIARIGCVGQVGRPAAHLPAHYVEELQKEIMTMIPKAGDREGN